MFFLNENLIFYADQLEKHINTNKKTQQQITTTKSRIWTDQGGEGELNTKEIEEQISF